MQPSILNPDVVINDFKARPSERLGTIILVRDKLTDEVVYTYPVYGNTRLVLMKVLELHLNDLFLQIDASSVELGKFINVISELEKRGDKGLGAYHRFDSPTTSSIVVEVVIPQRTQTVLYKKGQYSQYARVQPMDDVSQPSVRYGSIQSTDMYEVKLDGGVGWVVASSKQDAIRLAIISAKGVQQQKLLRMRQVEPDNKFPCVAVYLGKDLNEQYCLITDVKVVTDD